MEEKPIEYKGMKIAYSTEVQKELTKQVKLGNKLMYLLILTFVVMTVILLMLVTDSGYIGRYLARMVC